jgi:hypothetical protein
MALKGHPCRLRYGMASLIVHCVVAVAKQMYLHCTGQPVSPEPFLNIPLDQAWLWSAWLQVPVDFLQAIVFAGTVTLLAPLIKGRGSFEGQFSLYAFGFVPPTIILMLGTLLLRLLGLSDTVLWWLCFSSVSVWILAVIILTVSVEQQVDYKKAIACGLAGFIPSLAISLTYIR